jgi:hypothetical protein
LKLALAFRRDLPQSDPGSGKRLTGAAYRSPLAQPVASANL